MATEKENIDSWDTYDNSVFPGKLNIKKINTEELIQTVDNDNTFHIGRSYDHRPVALIKCIICGATDFNVGQGSYFTAIKCKNCEYEICIHRD